MNSSIDIQSPGVPRRLGDGIARFFTVFTMGFRGHLIPHGLMALMVISGYAAIQLGGGPRITPSFEELVERYLILAAAIVSIALLLIKFIRMAVIEKPERPLKHMVDWALAGLLDPARLANGLHGSIFVLMVMGGFGMWKKQVAVLGGFSWDPALAAFDQGLHGGLHPQTILTFLASAPWAAKIIDAAYVMWFPVLFGATLIMSFQPRRSELRLRFMIAFALAWIIGGIILANLFSSAGPVYFGRIHAIANPYAGHMAVLSQTAGSIHLEALKLQQTLWDAYTATPSFSAISAFPSMHVAITTLIFLACRHLGPWLKLASAIYLVLIGFGSVVLGWHYAIDGYAGAAVAVLVWWIAGRVARLSIEAHAPGVENMEMAGIKPDMRGTP